MPFLSESKYHRFPLGNFNLIAVHDVHFKPCWLIYSPLQLLTLLQGTTGTPVFNESLFSMNHLNKTPVTRTLLRDWDLLMGRYVPSKNTRKLYAIKIGLVIFLCYVRRLTFDGFKSFAFCTRNSYFDSRVKLPSVCLSRAYVHC